MVHVYCVKSSLQSLGSQQIYKCNHHNHTLWTWAPTKNCNYVISKWLNTSSTYPGFHCWTFYKWAASPFPVHVSSRQRMAWCAALCLLHGLTFLVYICEMGCNVLYNRTLTLSYQILYLVHRVFLNIGATIT